MPKTKENVPDDLKDESAILSIVNPAMLCKLDRIIQMQGRATKAYLQRQTKNPHPIKNADLASFQKTKENVPDARKGDDGVL